MRTIQVVLEEDLLRAADREARRNRVNRSALLRTALREFLRRKHLEEQVKRDRRGYERHPIQPGEFAAWDQVRSWPKD
jgi:metal-responsive CopG/Arc/MetJ family transcriptional regulator